MLIGEAANLATVKMTHKRAERPWAVLRVPALRPGVRKEPLSPERRLRARHPTAGMTGAREEGNTFVVKQE